MRHLSGLRLVFVGIGMAAVGLLWGSAAMVWLSLPGGSPTFMPLENLLPAVTISLAIFGGLGFGAAVMTERWEKEALRNQPPD
ncbi:hypothetical protein [Thalassospira alkalitolerans]|uniref:hypothetical protein n=1 Tax=Thalassospira alkalitolerans TaxID=1293890 RepID=UPI003AA89320